MRASSIDGFEVIVRRRSAATSTSSPSRMAAPSVLRSVVNAVWPPSPRRSDRTHRIAAITVPTIIATAPSSSNAIVTPAKKISSETKTGKSTGSA